MSLASAFGLATKFSSAHTHSRIRLASNHRLASIIASRPIDSRPLAQIAEVLSSAGEPWLGGDDFDLAIGRFIAERYELEEVASGRRVDERSATVRSLA